MPAPFRLLSQSQLLLPHPLPQPRPRLERHHLPLLVVERVFAAHGLAVFDVEEIPTHGGSLRVFAQRREAGREASPALDRVRRAEAEFGLDRRETYLAFADRVEESRLCISS